MFVFFEEGEVAFDGWWHDGFGFSGGGGCVEEDGFAGEDGLDGGELDFAQVREPGEERVPGASERHFEACLGLFLVLDEG